MPPPDKATILAGSPVFGMLDRALLNKIADRSTLSWHSDASDDFLFRAGDRSEGLYVVTSQGASVSSGPALQVGFGDWRSTTPRIGYRLSEGDVVGDLEFVLSGLAPSLPPRIASARMLRPLCVLHVPTACVDEAQRASEDFRRRLLRGAARRLSDLVVEKAGSRTAHPEIRLAEGLLGLLDDYGHEVANRGVFTTRLTQQQVAEHLGISRRLLSLRCSEWSARGLIETVPFGLPDIARLQRIASFGRESLRQSLPAAIGDIERMIAEGRLARASQLAADVLVLFPDNPFLTWLLALAAARMGARDRAVQTLASPAFRWDGSIANLKTGLRTSWDGSLAVRQRDAGEMDEEDESALGAFLEARLNNLAIDIGALHARLAKDEVEATEPRQRGPAAREAALRYSQVHEAGPNHYCAINAATLYLIGGLPEYSERLAAEALRLARRGGKGYWALASIAEALLLLGRRGEADRALSEALASPDADSGKTTSTRRQLRLLADSGTMDVTSALTLLDPGRPVIFGGPSPVSSNDIAEVEVQMKSAIIGWLAGRKVPIAFAALASSTDVVFAEAVLQAGIPLRVALPFTVESLSDSFRHYGAGWDARFMRCLDQAETVTELWRHEVPKGVIEHHSLRAYRHVIGEAMLAAHTLQTAPQVLAITGAGPDASADLLATHNRAKHRHDVSVISLSFAGQRSARPPATGSPFAPVVFAFPRVETENASLATRLGRFGFTTRMMKDRRLAGQKACADWADALSVASALAAQEDTVPVRVICDYGPVLHRNHSADSDAILKLDASFDLTAAVFGEVFATPTFVMAALAAGGSPDAYTPISIAIEREPDGDGVYVRSSRKIYRVRMRGIMRTEDPAPSALNRHQERHD